MRVLTLDFWGIADHSLQWIGRGATWIWSRRCTTDDSTLYAAAGGAMIWAILGGAVGFALSDLSRAISAAGGLILGALLGGCLGFMFGAVVELIDSAIKDQLGSLNSK